jgi:hypothetical protein
MMLMLHSSQRTCQETQALHAWERQMHCTAEGGVLAMVEAVHDH